jgi:3-hydroxyisobutyrate dehydrogenase
MADKSEIGFIGIGNMGTEMVPHLINAGYPVAVYDIDKERQESFAANHNCRSATSLADLADGVDFVYTMLPDGHAVRNVMVEAEDGGLAKSLKPGSVVLDSSSCDPRHTRELADKLAQDGIQIVDAPVSGGMGGATDAKLVFMIGADSEEALERCRPVLEILGEHLFVVGGTGAGHAMKCLNNYVGSTGFLAGVEALYIGAKFGLDPNVMVDVLNESTGGNHGSHNSLKPDVIGRRFGTGFRLGLMAKDVKIAADLAEDLKFNAPLIRQSREILVRAREVIGFDADHTEALKYLEMLNGYQLGEGTPPDLD